MVTDTVKTIIPGRLPLVLGGCHVTMFQWRNRVPGIVSLCFSQVF